MDVPQGNVLYQLDKKQESPQEAYRKSSVNEKHLSLC